MMLTMFAAHVDDVSDEGVDDEHGVFSSTSMVLMNGSEEIATSC